MLLDWRNGRHRIIGGASYLSRSALAVGRKASHGQLIVYCRGWCRGVGTDRRRQPRACGPTIEVAIQVWGLEHRYFCVRRWHSSMFVAYILPRVERRSWDVRCDIIFCCGDGTLRHRAISPSLLVQPMCTASPMLWILGNLVCVIVRHA